MGSDYFTSIPTELIASILFFVDKSADLLAFALTSKVHHAIIVPNLLNNRHIQCALENADFWKALAENPSIGANVRDLRITSSWRQGSNFGAFIPGFVAQKSPATGESYDQKYERLSALLAVAVSKMPFLLNFFWEISKHRPPNCVVEALYRSCPQLTCIEILNYDRRKTTMERLKPNESRLFDLSRLTSFSYSEHIHAWNIQVHDDYVNRLVDMLVHRCPNLEDLQVFFHYAHHPRLSKEIIGRLGTTGRWPTLKRLNVERVALGPNPKDFFAAHPLLESLAIVGGSDDLALDLSNLHKLKSLCTSWMPSIGEVPPHIASRLNYLDVDLGYNTSAEDFRSLLSETSSLKSLVVRYSETEYDPDFIKEVVVAVPHLERLSLELHWAMEALYGAGPSGNTYEETPGAMEDVLKALPNLTHLSPLFLHQWKPDNSAELAKEEITAAALKAIASRVVTLQYVGLADDTYDGPIWRVIERDEEGIYNGYHNPAGWREAREIETDSWGGIYYGAGADIVHRLPYYF